jgi:hypothetical protein
MSAQMWLELKITVWIVYKKAGPFLTLPLQPNFLADDK